MLDLWQNWAFKSRLPRPKEWSAAQGHRGPSDAVLWRGHQNGRRRGLRETKADGEADASTGDPGGFHQGKGHQAEQSFQHPRSSGGTTRLPCWYKIFIESSGQISCRLKCREDCRASRCWPSWRGRLFDWGFFLANPCCWQEFCPHPTGQPWWGPCPHPTGQPWWDYCYPRTPVSRTYRLFWA